MLQGADELSRADEHTDQTHLPPAQSFGPSSPPVSSPAVSSSAEWPSPAPSSPPPSPSHPRRRHCPRGAHLLHGSRPAGRSGGAAGRRRGAAGVRGRPRDPRRRARRRAEHGADRGRDPRPVRPARRDQPDPRLPPGARRLACRCRRPDPRLVCQRGPAAPRFSETLLSAYESGQKRPGPEYLHYLCAVYRAEPADLGYPGQCFCGRPHRAGPRARPASPGARAAGRSLRATRQDRAAAGSAGGELPACPAVGRCLPGAAPGRGFRLPGGPA